MATWTANSEFHHQTGGKVAPAIHPWKKRFEAAYGTQEELMEMCMADYRKREGNFA